MKRVVVVDPELGELSDDLLTRDVRVWQRVGGHRFSSDDMVTAYVAVGVGAGARRVCDLGAGLGSVLLHLAWSLPEATLVGVEAQAVSYALLTRNVERNGLGGRVEVRQGDLRAEAVVAELRGLGPFGLVTGTPPYFPVETALDAEDTQRAYARIEYRGGVEAYLATAAQILADDGVVVLCGDHEAQRRVEAGAREVGLGARARLDVFPRTGAAALFSVWTLRRGPGEAAVTAMTLRDARGEPTADARRLKAFSGFA